MNTKFFIRSRRVLTPGGLRPAALQISNGGIAAIRDFADVPQGAALEDFGNLVVMPGLVDTHVHVNEPGRTHWEGFETATRAAAAGGTTTLVEMPLNSIPPTTSVAAFHEKLAAAEGKLHVNVGFWGGVVPGNTHELEGLWRAGVFGFKCFLVPSGVDEFPHVTEADLRQAMPVLARLGAPLLVHAELAGPIEKSLASLGAAEAKQYRAWLQSRPAAAETEAITLLIRLCREFRARTHVVHLSAASALPLLRRARNERLPISVETCPQYLFFRAQEIGSGRTEFKCAPPIRESRNRAELWKALRRGQIDFVVSDHSPCPPEMKQGNSGDFLHAWGGIASLQLSLPVVWTAARRRGSALEDVSRWMAERTAQFVGLGKRKGRLAVGYDADIAVWDAQAAFIVDPAHLFHRHRLTPYAGRRLRGVVRATFVGGRKVYEHGEFPAGPLAAALKRT